MTLQGYGQPPDWDSATYYPPGQTVISAGSIYRAVNPLPGVAPPGAGWTLVVSGDGGGGGGLSVWDSGTTYSTGDLVIDREGTWQATGPNTNSRPISGNANWTLVGGTPYVAVSFTTNEINHLRSSPKQLLAAPGASKILLPVTLMASYTAGTISFPDGFFDVNVAQPFTYLLGTSQLPSFDAGFPIFFADATAAFPLNNQMAMGPAIANGVQSNQQAGVNQALLLSTVSTVPDFAGSLGIDATSFVLNAGGVGYAVSDVFTVTTGDGNALGVVDTVSSGGPFAITNVDQGTQTFTIAGDHAAIFTPASLFVVRGSTGNDGTYTVVSATFTVATDIVVVEAIPDATADGSLNNSAVTALHLVGSGSGYTPGTGVATLAQSASGVGLTVDIGAVGDGNGTMDITLYYQIVTVP